MPVGVRHLALSGQLPRHQRRGERRRVVDHDPLAQQRGVRSERDQRRPGVVVVLREVRHRQRTPGRAREVAPPLGRLPEVAPALEGPDQHAPRRERRRLVLDRPGERQQGALPERVRRQLGVAQAERGVDRAALRDVLGAARDPDRLLQPRAAVPLLQHPSYGAHVGAGVATVPAGQPGGLREAEPGLPGAQQLGRQAGVLRQLADGQQGVVRRRGHNAGCCQIAVAARGGRHNSTIPQYCV